MEVEFSLKPACPCTDKAHSLCLNPLSVPAPILSSGLTKASRCAQSTKGTLLDCLGLVAKGVGIPELSGNNQKDSS